MSRDLAKLMLEGDIAIGSDVPLPSQMRTSLGIARVQLGYESHKPALDHTGAETANM